MFAGLREHRVRSNPGSVIRRKSTRGKKSDASCMHESGRLWDPPKHENGARKGGVRMFAGLREHRVRSNPWSVIRRKHQNKKKR